MLALSLHIGPDHYAVPASEVAEVLPLTSLQNIPLAPGYIAGLLDYRGTPVPIIDLCSLITGHKHRKVLTTRIILIHYHRHRDKKELLGLVAEKVTETLHIDENQFKQSGISLKETPYLGTIIKQHESIIQLINADSLLTDEVRDMLFQEHALTKKQSA